MRHDDLRPDPSRGTEVLDAIDRWKARHPERCKAAAGRKGQPIRFDEDEDDEAMRKTQRRKRRA